MRLITNREEVLERLHKAGRRAQPILCPNAETPDEMEGIMVGAHRHAATRGLSRIVVGIGFTSTYPGHPQLCGLSFESEPGANRVAITARTWLRWLVSYVGRSGVFDGLEVIPFLDHGWAPHVEDMRLMHEHWFQNAVGIIMFDASAHDFRKNVELTSRFVRTARRHVVIEGCPDKVYERRELAAGKTKKSDLVSDPETVERFVRATGVDLIVPNLGTEHRTTSTTPLEYRRDIASDIADRVGPILALHGTSSLGGRLQTVGKDGICKINYYTAMVRDATSRLREAWGSLPGNKMPPLAKICGSFIHRTRRDAIADHISELLEILHGYSKPAVQKRRKENRNPKT